MNTPKDIFNYVMENKLDFDFISALMRHTNNFSIAEITDKKFDFRNNQYYLTSSSYKLNLPINDDEIKAALSNELYVSAFISRKDASYNVHFLVHKYPTAMKSQFEEEITFEVIRYMIMNTIIVLRLDTFEKIHQYIAS